ncbi:MAG: trigger factor [Clostridiales Family XIII bacterium]|jgi:trigger factor|nr:trigger factor [Clostridiales Family XIII bacterium]
MKAQVIEKQGAIVKFEIGYTAEEFENALIDAYKETKDQFRVDGFRKGKAPRKLIMQHYGAGIFDDEAVERLLQKDYPNSLIELGIEPIDRPSVDIPELKHGEAFAIAVQVETPPEFDVKDYEGVTVKGVSYPVTDEDVEAQLAQAQERGTRLVSVEREAQDGDTANIDYSGSVDGEKFEGGTDTGHSLKLGSGAFIPGFEEQLIGKRAGDKVDVKVTFPEEYHAEGLAGKEAVFAVTVNEVRADEKPEINDEFAQDISEFDTLEELRADMKRQMEEQGALRAEMETKDAILEKIYDGNEVDVPAVMVDDQLEEMLKDFEREIKQQGYKLEQYFQLTQQSPKDLRERIKLDAYKRVKMKLIVQNIARLQGFGASDDELGEELGKMAEQYSMETDKLREVLGEFQLKLLKDDITNKKAVDYIYANAIAESE